jgi:hypothetical protein
VNDRIGQKCRAWRDWSQSGVVEAGKWLKWYSGNQMERCSCRKRENNRKKLT